MSSKKCWLSCVGAVLLWAAPALAWEIPLTVEEQWGQGGIRHVTGGVPLLVGQAKEAADLRLAVKDAEGRLVAVPAQFRVLARWWRADNSIRWVLVDFTTGINDFQKKTFYLTTGTEPAPAPKPAKPSEPSKKRPWWDPFGVWQKDEPAPTPKPTTRPKD